MFRFVNLSVTEWLDFCTFISRAYTIGNLNVPFRKSFCDGMIKSLQFHWWAYDVPYYVEALKHLQEIKEEGKIKHLGLTNFDTKHLKIVTDKDIQIASNQVSQASDGQID